MWMSARTKEMGLIARHTPRAAIQLGRFTAPATLASMEMELSALITTSALARALATIAARPPCAPIPRDPFLARVMPDTMEMAIPATVSQLFSFFLVLLFALSDNSLPPLSPSLYQLVQFRSLFLLAFLLQ